MIRGGAAKALGGMSGPAPGRWLFAAGLEWAAIVATLSAARTIDSLPVYLVAVFVLATRQHALAILGHEGTHRLVARSARWNDILSSLLCLGPLGMPLGAYRRFHLAHHRYLGGAQDPERPWVTEANRLPRPLHATVGRFLADCLGAGAGRIRIIMSALRPTGRELLVQVLFLLAVHAALFLVGVLWVAALWWLALVTAFVAVFRVREWSEHTGITGTHRFRAGFLARLVFFPHNTWCHAEHHAHPGIPCHRLPDARRLLGDGREPSALELFRRFGRLPEAHEGVFAARPLVIR